MNHLPVILLGPTRAILDCVADVPTTVAVMQGKYLSVKRLHVPHKKLNYVCNMNKHCLSVRTFSTNCWLDSFLQTQLLFFHNIIII